MNRISVFLTAIFMTVASACEKERNRDFPNVGFEEFVYLNNPSNLDLLNVGGSVYHPGGFKGLIIYRRHDLGRQDDFGAYDRGCPEHYREDCAQLSISDDGTFAECACGGERYLLFDGSPSEEATISLVESPTVRAGNVLRVFN